MNRMIKRSLLSGISGLAVIGTAFAAPFSVKEARAEADHVFQVLFPSDTDHVFDFIMDPQELIRKTDAAAYGDLIFEEGATLFFRRHDGRAEEDYSSTSDALVITNTGTADVEVVVSASISQDSMEKITMTDDGTFTDDMEASLYLALTDGEHVVPVTGETDAVIRTTLAGTGEAEGVIGEYRFWLVGAANRNGDWSEVREAVPKVTVTWSAGAVLGEEESSEMREDSGTPELPEGSEVPEAGEAVEGSEPLKTGENIKGSEPLEAVEGTNGSKPPGTGENMKGSEPLEAVESTNGSETLGIGESIKESEMPEAVERAKGSEPLGAKETMKESGFLGGAETPTGSESPESVEQEGLEEK